MVLSSAPPTGNTRVYRLLRARYAQSPFDGEGSFRYGGRWSSPGTRLVYTSERESLALLEYFAHLDPADLPTDLVLAVADVPSNLSHVSVPANDLPTDWRSTPAPLELARLGDEFVAQGRTAILVVPSVLAPNDSNWLLNPAHPDFRRIAIGEAEPFAYDRRRLDRKKARKRAKELIS